MEDESVHVSSCHPKAEAIIPVAEPGGLAQRWAQEQGPKAQTSEDEAGEAFLAGSTTLKLRDKHLQSVWKTNKSQQGEQCHSSGLIGQNKRMIFSSRALTSQTLRISRTVSNLAFSAIYSKSTAQILPDIRSMMENVQ
ncbi:hypothetical protein CVT26_005631 [Gymnopilus dilepis]|uniref:Uncharacterized protein n=1 Tax=Gymnopilus dilepis TaxID=231916 RepID=A0A409Y020_9AGAR|nr:hypothetical protein CVT26_005631 [Gymnopilus dilepis]